MPFPIPIPTSHLPFPFPSHPPRPAAIAAAMSLRHQPSRTLTDPCIFSQQVLIDYTFVRAHGTLTLQSCTLSGTCTLRNTSHLTLTSCTLFNLNAQDAGQLLLTGCKQGFGRTISLDGLDSVVIEDCRFAGALHLSGCKDVVVRDCNVGQLRVFNCKDVTVEKDVGVGELRLDNCRDFVASEAWFGKLAVVDCLNVCFRGGVVCNP